MAHAFHAGELAVQARAGESSIAVRNASVITDTVISGARPFIEKQVMVATATRDTQGRNWASIQFGAPGFLRSPEGRHIEITAGHSSRSVHDPFWEGAHHGAQAGLLFIELSTRRRYRVNGTVEHRDEEALRVAIAEAYPNCPKYIQRRHPRMLPAPVPNTGTRSVQRGQTLDDTTRTLISAADTLFIASGTPGGHLDASHRGGPIGFIQVLDPRRLRVPDYAGNSLFNTMGNLALDPACGLVVPDFASGGLLHLTGRAQLLWGQPDPYGVTGGTDRFWEFEIDEWILREGAMAHAWEYLDASPFNPKASP